MADERGWVWQMEVLRRQFPGLPLTSGYRPGAITATGNESYHGKGRAVDIPPRMDVFEWIRTTYGANTKELIYSPAGGRQIHNGQPHVYTGVTKANHYDHVHWAIIDQTGGAAANMQTVGTATSNPIDALRNTFQQTGQQISDITNPQLWLRVGAALGGLLLLLIAFATLTKRPIALKGLV